MHNKKTIFDAAVEITKEYARSGATTPVQFTFEKMHEILKKIAEQEGILNK